MSGRQISAIVCTQLELASQQLSGDAGVEDGSRWCVARKKTGRSIMPHTLMLSTTCAAAICACPHMVEQRQRLSTRNGAMPARLLLTLL